MQTFTEKTGRTVTMRVCVIVLTALLAATSIASAASRNHLNRHHYGQSYRAGASTATASHFQSKFDNN
jgi:hypothetical protein